MFRLIMQLYNAMLSQQNWNTCHISHITYLSHIIIYHIMSHNLSIVLNGGLKDQWEVDNGPVLKESF